MRVLIADDQRSFATVLADMVRYCGHQVVATVGSGFEAIQAYTVHKPDLVLMDHRMPKLNGVTASRHIIAKNPEARVVLLSAWSPLDGADESGAICYLPKPVEMARLNAVLLTISHSLPPSEADLPPPDPAAFSVDSMPYVPIPQEIISPVETFPIMSFPLEDPVSLPPNDVDQTTEPDIVETGVVDPVSKSRKTRKVRARNKGNSRPR
jgi:two-component system chemotaxis response regulator CheY